METQWNAHSPTETVQERDPVIQTAQRAEEWDLLGGRAPGGSYMHRCLADEKDFLPEREKDSIHTEEQHMAEPSRGSSNASPSRLELPLS